MNRLVVALNAIALVLFSTVGVAQQTVKLETGVRVRVTRSHGDRVIGTVVGKNEDSLYLRSDGANSSVRSTSSGDIQKLEVSYGRSRGKGALVNGAAGLAIGAVSGALIGGLTYSEPDTGTSFCVVVCSKGQAAAALGFVGGITGLVIGAAAGLISGRESWTTVPYQAGR